MSRLVFADSKVEYLLPSAAEANEGDVIAVTSAVNGLTLGFQAGGGGGGLTQADVYGQGAVYALPVIAGATPGEAVVVQNGVLALGNVEGLTQAEMYGASAIYQLPDLAAATPGQVAQKSGNALAFVNAPPPSLTQQQVYGNGDPYPLPEIGDDGQIMTIQGGAPSFTTYSGLLPSDLWEDGPNYTLPSTTGAPIGGVMKSDGANGLEFALTPTVVLPVTLYGGASVEAPNPAFTLGVIADAADGDVLTVQAGNPQTGVWATPTPGIAAADLWENPASAIKIPDYAGSQNNTMFAFTGGSASAWNAPPESIAVADLWADPQPVVYDNYRLPIAGAASTALAVSGTPNTLEYIPAATQGTTTVSAGFQSQFAGASTAQTILFSKTGKAVVCTITSGNGIATDGTTGAALKTVTFVPDSYPAIQAYMPQSGIITQLGIMLMTEDATGAWVGGTLSIDPATGVITWSNVGFTYSPTDPNSYFPSINGDAGGASYMGSWFTD